MNLNIFHIIEHVESINKSCPAWFEEKNWFLGEINFNYLANIFFNFVFFRILKKVYQKFSGKKVHAKLSNWSSNIYRTMKYLMSAKCQKLGITWYADLKLAWIRFLSMLGKTIQTNWTWKRVCENIKIWSSIEFQATWSIIYRKVHGEV